MNKIRTIENIKIPIRMCITALLLPFFLYIILFAISNSILSTIATFLLLTAPLLSFLGLILGIFHAFKFREYDEKKGTIVKGIVCNSSVLILHVVFFIFFMYLVPLV